MVRRCAALTVALLLAGCGSLCARADAAAKTFTTKAMRCGATAPKAAFDRQACEASMGQCSSQDTAIIDAYFDCLEKLPTCDPDAPATFSAAVLACANPMQGVSPGCFVQ
jgi:uncharacterized protein YceK